MTNSTTTNRTTNRYKITKITSTDCFTDKIKSNYDNLNTMNTNLPGIQLSYNKANLTLTFTLFILHTTTDILNLTVTSKWYSPMNPYKL